MKRPTQMIDYAHSENRPTKPEECGLLPNHTCNADIVVKVGNNNIISLCSDYSQMNRNIIPTGIDGLSFKISHSHTSFPTRAENARAAALT